MLYNLAKPFLFTLDEEVSHELTLSLLRRGAGRLYPSCVPAKPVEVMGLSFPNPVGLAAGLDKNGDCVSGMSALGFGFLEVGTVTPRPQSGNTKPRLFRLPAANALINRMGFNNHGVDYLLRAVESSRYDGVLGINIGKNADTPVEDAASDYLFCMERIHQAASYVVVNVSSPNTPGLRTLQHGDALEQLLGQLREKQTLLDQASGRRVPLVIKVAPDNSSDEVLAMTDALVRHEMDGVIVGNTTLTRTGVEALKHGQEAGGMSGAPLKPLADQTLSAFCDALDGRIPVIGVGGVLSGADARDKQRCGASLVQVYSGLIYRGPGLVREAVEAWDVTA